MKIRSSFVVILFLSSGLFAIAFAIAARGQSPKLESRKVPVNQPNKHLPNDTVGVVNGEVITYADFRSIMSGYLKTFVDRSNNNVVSDSLYSVIVDSSWDRAITDIITEREMGKRHIALTNEQIVDSLAQSPSDYLRKQFTDSLGSFHGDIMRRALTDPRNDSIANIILDDERVRIENEEFLNTYGPKNATPAERQKAFEVWLLHTKAKAHITDYRIRFGFY